MPSQVQPISHADLGRGIDQFHAENKLADGYWQDILNGDALNSGSVVKRVGYQRYAGGVPLRAASVSESGGVITISFDSHILFPAGMVCGPLVIWGRVSSSSYAHAGFTAGTDSLMYVASPTLGTGGGNCISFSATSDLGSVWADSAPQITVWGVDWKLLQSQFPDTDTRFGWVNHLDNYRNLLESRPVCGLGGMLYASRTYEEAGGTYGLPRQGISVLQQAASTTTVGPAFWTTGSAPARTRGYVTADDCQSNWLTCASASYNTGTGFVDFQLTGQNLTASATVSGIISAGADWLTTKQLPGAYTGTFLVQSVSLSAGQLTVSCSVPGVVDGRSDTSGALGLAAVLTDSLLLAASSVLDVGDLVQATAIPTTDAVSVATVSGSTVYLGPLGKSYTVTAGSYLAATRTSRAVALPSVTDFVRGDMLAITGYARRFCVTGVNPLADQSISIVGSGTTATATVAAGTSWLAVGDVVKLRYTSYAGDVVVTSVPSGTTFQFASSGTTTESATLVGHTISLDEAPKLQSLTTATTTYIQVHARWAPLEMPPPISDAATQTCPLPLAFGAGFGSKQFVRSTNANQNMYFTDYYNGVMKFDGVNLTRAGLPRWQAVALITRDLISIGKIANTNPQVPVLTGTTGSTFVVASGAQKQVAIGDVIELVSATSPQYTQYVVRDNTLDGKIVVDRTISESWVTGSYVIRTMLFKYYARLNCVDANRNVVASAAAGINDCAMRIGANSGIRLRLLLPPKFQQRDFGRMEVQLYRTADLTVTGVAQGLYGLVARYPIYQDVMPTYIDISDSTQLAEMVDTAQNFIGTKDPLATVVGGNSINTQWAEPPLAKYVSNANQRLLLANIKSRPQLDVVLRKNPFRTTSTSADYHLARFELRKQWLGSGAYRPTQVTGAADDRVGYQFIRGGATKGLLTVGFANISANTITQASHGLVRGQAVHFDATGSSGGVVCPTGITSDLKYYVVPLASDPANKFRLAASYTDALAGTTIPLSLASGTANIRYGNVHTGGMTVNPYINTSHSFASTDINTSTGQFTWTGHPLFTGDVIYFDASNCPGGLVPRVAYFINVVDANHILVCTTRTNALAGVGVIPSSAPGTVLVWEGGFIQLTLTEPHGLGSSTTVVGYAGWVYIWGVGSTYRGARTGGWFQVIQIQGWKGLLCRALTVDDSGSVLGLADRVCFADNPFDVPVLLDETTNDLNFGSVTGNSSGTQELVAARRLATAINWTQSTAMLAGGAFSGNYTSSFTPWCVAGGGNDYDSGQIVVEQIDNLGQTMSIVTPATSAIDVFVGGVRQAPGTEVSATQRVNPSRMLRSYANYPEAFDNPFGATAQDSDSIIDVNPSDGQQITGMVPFYGDSQFGAQLKESMTIVFKEYGIYAVDVESRAVQKIETNGVGCTYPRSIAATKNGIMFANESGLFKLDRNMNCVFIGQIVNRIWKGHRNLTADSELPSATHHYLGHQYKLSYPVGSGTSNSEVLVYDHTREYSLYGSSNAEDTASQSQTSQSGAWSRYDNHPATGWCNGGPDSFFGATNGIVYSIRRAGDQTDYRDDAGGVDFLATYKALNFGTSGLRKMLRAVVASFRVAYNMAATVVRLGTEMTTAFQDLDAVTVDQVTLQATANSSALSDIVRGQSRSLRFSVPINRGNYFQVQVENSAIDEPLELSQLDFVAETLTEKGVEDAASSAANNSQPS